MDSSLFTTSKGIQQLETELLPPWIVEQRWFSGKARIMSTVRVVDSTVLGPAYLLNVEVGYSSGDSENYTVPLVIENGSIVDAVVNPEFREALFAMLKSDKNARLNEVFTENDMPKSELLNEEQSNTSIIYGDRMVIKLYRKLTVGINPDAELTRFITEKTNFAQVPAYYGALDWAGASLALATEWVPNKGSAWALALASMKESSWPARARQLGQRTGELHIALSSDELLPKRSRVNVDSTFSDMNQLLRLRLESLSNENQELAREVLTKPLPVPNEFEWLKTRTHGDYHLGQVLDTGNDFMIIDFEGEPSRSLAERRAKHPPIRDVAGMLRSFHYAAHVARKSDPSRSIEQTERWAEASEAQFLSGWQSAIIGSKLEPEYTESLLEFYRFEKAAYEVIYELNHRPDWVDIPLRGFLR